MRKKLLSLTILCSTTLFFASKPFTIQSNGSQPIDLKTLLAQHNQRAQAVKPLTAQPQKPPLPAQPEQIIPKPDHPILKGLIQAPENINELPRIKILFAGQQTKIDSEGFYSFPLEKSSSLSECNLLICNQINSNFNGINTIENLSINPHKKHRFFSLKKIELKDNKYKWNWSEQTLQQNDFIIPQNCIVVLIHPKYFERIDEWQIQLMDSFIGLPKIVLKNNILNNKLTRTSAKSHLYTLDNQYFHETIKQESKKFADKPNVQVLLER